MTPLVWLFTCECPENAVDWGSLTLGFISAPWPCRSKQSHTSDSDNKTGV